MEDSLANHANPWRALLERSPDLVLEVDVCSHRCVACNDGAVIILGREPADLVGRDIAELVHPEDARSAARLFGEPRASRPPTEHVLRLRHRDGSWRWLEASTQWYRAADGPRVVARARDVTEHRATVASILGSAMDAIVTVDADQRIVLFNRAAEAMFGVSATTAIGAPLDRFIPERFRAAHREHVARFAATGSTTRRMGRLSQVFGLRHDGEEFPVEASLSQAVFDGQKHLTVILRDVSDRLRAERARNELLGILDETRNEIYVIDAHTLHFRYANRAACENLGFGADELRQLSCAEISSRPREELETIFAALRCGERETAHLAMEHHRHDGTSYPVDVYYQIATYGAAPSVLAVTIDMTESRRLERQLVEAEQLASISTLAAGIAHDIGTPLNVISGYAELIERGAQDEASRKRARIVKTQIARISDLIQTLLNVSRPHKPVRVPVDLEMILDQALMFFEERLAKRGIKVEREFQAVPPVVGDPDRLQQAFLNLLVNACDAMPEGGILRARLVTSNEGHKVCIALRDTGTGIPSDELTKIFEPFFTTKDRGHGTGLGLFVVKSIIADHRGSIEAESALGEGTEFQIWLPAAPSFHR